MKSTMALAFVILATIANYDIEAAAMGEIKPEMDQLAKLGTDSHGTPDGIPNGKKAVLEDTGCLKEGRGCSPFGNIRCCSGKCEPTGHIWVWRCRE